MVRIHLLLQSSHCNREARVHEQEDCHSDHTSDRCGITYPSTLNGSVSTRSAKARRRYTFPISIRLVEQTPTNYQQSDTLLQRNEFRGVSSTNTRAVVLHRLVRQRELAQVVADHLSLDFNVVEVAAVVHAHHRTDHLGNHDHVAEVSLHRVRTLVLGSLGLLSLNNVNYNTHSLAQSLDQRLGLSLQTAAESATRASLLSHAFPSPYIDQLHQVLRRHIQQFVQIHSTVRELLERSLLLLLSVHLNVVVLLHRYSLPPCPFPTSSRRLLPQTS